MLKQRPPGLRRQLEETASTLAKYGFSFWASKLKAIVSSVAQRNKSEILADISKLYGGFGTLMDLAVDPHSLPFGVTEEDANKELLHAINALYDLVKIA
jgi:hypothetical protein